MKERIYKAWSWVKEKVSKFWRWILITVFGLGLALAAPIALNQATPCLDLSSTIVHERIKDLPANERAGVKGQEIAELKCVEKIRRIGQYFNGFIEIVFLESIDGGVEVLARAWDVNNEQIGFGKDGTVDLERFLFYNPPILVSDPNGSIVRNSIDITTGESIIHKYRENLREALLQDLEHTIKVKTQKSDSSKIIAGKIGNTTSTFHPAAGANSPVDGYTLRIATESWTSTVNGNGTGSGSSDTNFWISAFIRGDSQKQIVRDASLFGTSTIDDGDTVDSATVSLEPDALDTTNDAAVAVVDGSPASDSAMADADYQNAFTISSPTEYATRRDVSDLSTGAGYEDWPLTNLTIINKTGLTKIGWRLSDDIDDTEPTGGGTNDNVRVKSADTSGTTSDPKLVVEHSVPSAGTDPNSILFLYLPLKYEEIVYI